jgi:hypothetical protein
MWNGPKAFLEINKEELDVSTNFLGKRGCTSNNNSHYWRTPCIIKKNQKLQMKPEILNWNGLGTREQQLKTRINIHL